MRKSRSLSIKFKPDRSDLRQ